MAHKSNPKELLKLRNRQSRYKEKLTLSALREKSDKFKEPKWPLINKKKSALREKSDPKLQAFPKKDRKWMTKKKEYVDPKFLETFGGKRIQKKGGPELRPFKHKQVEIQTKLKSPEEYKAKGGRIGKQFGGGLPIQPTAGANLQPTVGANLQPPVGANPMGVADPSRRFGMKHGSKSKGGRTGLKHGGSAGAAKRGHGAEIK